MYLLNAGEYVQVFGLSKYEMPEKTSLLLYILTEKQFAHWKSQTFSDSDVRVLRAIRPTHLI